jgi:hypothetical protein
MPLYRESFVFVMETDDPAIFWTGHTDLLLPDDDVLPAPTIALGSGDLINLPDLEALLNGIAQRVEITLSGVSENSIRFAAEEADQVPGAAVHIGRVEFDEEWQLAGPVTWEWSGVAQKLTLGGEQGSDGRTRSITLRIAAGDTTRARAPYAFFTDADQRRDFPDDAFFSHVAGINAGTSRRFGPAQ